MACRLRSIRDLGNDEQPTQYLAWMEEALRLYPDELQVTSDILTDLSDQAFRNIALGENYFRTLGLDYSAPEICSSQTAPE